jgi:gas vesicle protein
MKKLINHGILIGALLAATALPLAAQTSGSTGETNQPSHHGQWKAMREQMAAEIKAQDAELEQLVTVMNNAPEDQKADAVAAVVDKLVADRLAMHQQMENMRQHMGGTNMPPEGTGTTPPPSP